MKLQRATRIALYAILELAADPDRQITASSIADRYGVSINHLAKVMRDLGRAGWVEAVRGAGGGYRFTGNVKRISLYDVVNLFGDIASNAGEIEGQAGDTAIGRALASVLGEIDAIAIATFRSISLATLLKSLERDRDTKVAAE